ncbi:MAG TPA: phosphate acyltransferase PlsX [Longimicrobiales bacterium]|nr:phosphate acyltransferase PlsX [Longimicrobiales bacterium]
MSRLAVDAMGGDFAPRAIVEGIGEALDRGYPDLKVFVVGQREKVEAELTRIGKLGDPRVEVVEAPEVIGMEESPASGVRSKRRSSINVAVDLVKSGEAQAVISAGNTGAAVASTVLKLRTLPGIERPGIATVLPSSSGRFVLLDSGSTVDCKPIHLVHYAIMGDAYERYVLGKESPRIGLLNVGGEVQKGNELTKETFKLLKDMKGLNFIGNVEGHDLFSGGVDVVVCDGFVGNVVLKTCESLASAIGSMLREALGKTVPRKLGYLLSRNAFREIRELCDYAEAGGAPLLGVNGICIIGHGSSCPRAVRNAIRVADDSIRHDVNAKIVGQVRDLLNSTE